MTVNERRKYLKLMKPRYQKARRAERSRLLSEMQEVTGLLSLSLLRLLHASSLNRKKRTTPRKGTYGLATEQVLLVVWESLDYVCVELLTPVLLATAQHLARFPSVRLSSEVVQQLGQRSFATLTRRLTQVPQLQAVPATQRARAGQPAEKRGAHETHCLGTRVRRATARWIWCIMGARVRPGRTLTPSN